MLGFALLTPAYHAKEGTMGEKEQFEADFDFTSVVLEGFFKLSRIQRTLSAILDKGVTGWEKWWQVELALYLSEHPEIGEWDMEEPFFTDRRREKNKDMLAIDICFRRKKHSINSMIFLELKQDGDWKRCITNMINDAEKVYSAHTKSHSGLAIRNFFLAGVYPSIEKAEVKDFVLNLAERRDVPVERIITKFIPNTDMSVTLF